MLIYATYLGSLFKRKYGKIKGMHKIMINPCQLSGNGIERRRRIRLANRKGTKAVKPFLFHATGYKTTFLWE